MIYTALGAVAVTLLMVISGFDLFGLAHWWVGLGAGAVVAIAWLINRRVGQILGLIGVALLILAMAGVAKNMPVADRALFNGMALGTMLGLGIGAAWRWRRIRPTVVELARVERVRWLSKLLGDSSAR
jgi:hypothetical protein